CCSDYPVRLRAVRTAQPSGAPRVSDPMHLGRIHKTGLSIAVICAVIAACLVPTAAGAATTGDGKEKLSKREQRREQLAKLRRQNRNQKRPNVIVIDTDDMNQSDIWIMRNTLALLGARGTTFNNSYVSYPLCCPSRATFLTGQYSHNNGVIT